MNLARGFASALLLASWAPAWAMGLRAFQVLPLEPGGTVVRGLVAHDRDSNINTLMAETAFGLSAKQTLFLGLPYRLSSGPGNRTGDLSVVYRYQLWSQDQPLGTRRIGLLGGAVLPTGGGREARVQAGAIATVFSGRHELDADFLWADRGGTAPAAGRYDLSWQYRLNGGGSGWEPEVWWMGVTELGGRWAEGNNTTHQFTLGLQRITSRWVLEGGVVRDLNAPHDTNYLLSVRLHF